MIYRMVSTRWLCGAAIALVLGGCATSSTPLRADALTRQAVDTPDRFLVGLHDSDATSEPEPGEGCRNPMVDPRDRTRLILMRAAEQLGDYEVPAGRYGVGQKELLRLECNTGRSIGIARR
jgi:hypothetical protein